LSDALTAALVGPKPDTRSADQLISDLLLAGNFQGANDVYRRSEGIPTVTILKERVHGSLTAANRAQIDREKAETEALVKRMNDKPDKIRARRPRLQTQFFPA